VLRRLIGERLDCAGCAKYRPDRVALSIRVREPSQAAGEGWVKTTKGWYCPWCATKRKLPIAFSGDGFSRAVARIVDLDAALRQQVDVERLRQQKVPPLQPSWPRDPVEAAKWALAQSRIPASC
jgi:hypothetical protein